MLVNPERTLVQRIFYPFWVVFYWIYLGVFALLAFIVNISSIFTSLLPAGEWRYNYYQAMVCAMSRGTLWLFKTVGILHVRYVGFDTLPTNRETIKPVLVANHPNLFDVFLFYGKLPALTCIYKSSLQKTLIKNSMGEQMGFISNANPKKMIIEGANRIQAGEQLLIFPEGTRTEVWPLNKLKSGAVGIARRANVSLQTVITHCGSNFLSKGQPLLKPPILPVFIRMEVGKAFDPKDYENSQSLNRAMADYFKAKLREERTFK